MKNEKSEQRQAAGDIEAVEVVAYRGKRSGLLVKDPEGLSSPDELMTVAQHSRMMAAKDVEIAALKQAGAGADELESFNSWFAVSGLTKFRDTALAGWQAYARLNASRDEVAALAGQQHSPKPVGDSQCENYGGPDGMWLNECLTPRIANASRDGMPEGLPMVIAGALFDFAGFLTSRGKVIKVGASANTSPMIELLKEWAGKRGLELHDAAVLSWQELLAAVPTPAPAHSADDGMVKVSRELLAKAEHFIDQNVYYKFGDPVMPRDEMGREIQRELRAILSQTSGVEHE